VDIGRIGNVGVGLVELREALADLGGANADDRVFAGVVVGTAAKDLGADDAFAEEMVFLREGVLDDVAEQVLALQGVAEGLTGDRLLKNLMDGGRVDGRML
jgi:hypothetical protein